MRLLLVIGLLAFTQAQSPPTEHARIVEAFVQAFNVRDVDGMLALVTDDVEWLSMDGASVSVETSGKAALAESMQNYFASCPSCRSEVAIGAQTTARVAAVETATWSTATGTRAQRSLSVYEFAGDLIRRVSYYPAER